MKNLDSNPDQQKLSLADAQLKVKEFSARVKKKVLKSFHLFLPATRSAQPETTLTFCWENREAGEVPQTAAEEEDEAGELHLS